MKVLEIFKSIQGEGSQMGRVCAFIRTQGCNLSCPWCDTKESWGVGHAKEMTPKEIGDAIEALGVEFVVITGGEPTIQPDLRDVVRELHLLGVYVAIETNGTNPVWDEVDWVACSPKPQSGYMVGCRANELKYVVTKGFNAEIAIPKHVREAYAGRIWLQPNGYDMTDTWKMAYELAQADHRLRVGVQLHKIMEVK